MNVRHAPLSTAVKIAAVMLRRKLVMGFTPTCELCDKGDVLCYSPMTSVADASKMLTRFMREMAPTISPC
eukprot:5689214-Amphidinium_carterae.1